MRIVLVEDENTTRNGILHMIQQFTDYEVTGMAMNGAEGYELILREHPDLVITDIRMPVMDGLEMLQKLKDTKVKINAILLTGYSDFEYARKALKLQVIDYLLKPLDVEEFLKVLGTVENRISNSRLSEVSAEQMLVNYLESRKEEQELVLEHLNERLHANDRTECSLFLISPKKMYQNRIVELMKYTRELLDVLCIGDSYVFQVPGEKRLMVIVVGTEKNRSLKNRFALKLLPKLDEIGYCYCVFDKIHGIRELPEKTGQMAQKLSLAFSLPDCRIIDEEAAASVQYSTKEYPEQLEHLMIRELRNGNKKKIAGYGQHFIEEITDAKADPEQVREYAIRLVANVFHIAKEMKEYLNEEENIRYFMEMILASENRDEVKYQLEKFFNMISSDARDEILTENGMVMNAVSYIRENYREEITLSDVAKVCRVTPEYLSRIFYRETGVNFSPFLQKFRISMAKRMLMTENMKVYEVAEAVGFKDQKYFVTVFKKLCGMTPMEYRKEIRG